MTTLTLKHIGETADSTASELMLGDRHLCYIVEDGYREVKVPGRTRIPAGTYELFPRQSGGFWGRYKERFKHDFVIGFKSVPGFTWILIHIGNKIDDTRGCLLCNTEIYLANDGNYRGAGSTDAYLKLHSLFEMWFEKGPVEIVIDRGVKPEVPVVVPDEGTGEPVVGEPVTPDEPTVDKPEDPPLNERSGCFPALAPRPLALAATGDYDPPTTIRKVRHDTSFTILLAA